MRGGRGGGGVLGAVGSMPHAKGHGCLCHAVRSSGPQAVASRPEQLGGYGRELIADDCLFHLAFTAFGTASCASERSCNVGGVGAQHALGQPGMDGLSMHPQLTGRAT